MVSVTKISGLFRLVRSFRFGRFFHFILLRLSYNFAKWGITKNPWGLPIALSIEPTTACNLGCPACPSGLKSFSRATGNLSVEAHKEWIKKVKHHVGYINYYFQGEPTIHPQFIALIQTAKAAGIYTSTSTNAHFITENYAKELVKSGLDRIIVSMDGIEQQTYENYRVHGKLETVKQGLQALAKAKKELKKQHPTIILQFLVTNYNEHEIDALTAFSTEVGVDELRLKTLQLYDFEKDGHLLPKNEKYRRYILDKDGNYRIKNKFKDECWRMWSSAVITWDGKIVPCCFDKDAQHQMGNINNTSFQQIWKGTAYNEFRKQLLMNRKSIAICANCTEGTEVFVE